MDEMAGANTAPTQTAAHVNKMARPFPPGLVPVAVLLAAAVGLLSLLPSLAQAVWEVPHLFLLGLVISYGVFAHNTADADKAGAGDTKVDGAVAWSSRYHPDNPLVVVADHAASDADDGEHCARERPLSLPVRRLKPAAAQVSEAGNYSDGVGEETDSSASSAGFWAGATAAPSPPSVLDADVSHTPCSQPEPPSPPFSVHGNRSRRSDAAATLFTKPRGFPAGYQPVPHDQPSSDDGEVTDWDEEADGFDQMTTVSSERSFRGDFTAIANGSNDHSDGDTSVDEELLKLVRKEAPEGADEVDRKADEFIAKFREQIRLQRH